MLDPDGLVNRLVRDLTDSHLVGESIRQRQGTEILILVRHLWRPQM